MLESGPRGHGTLREAAAGRQHSGARWRDEKEKAAIAPALLIRARV